MGNFNDEDFKEADKILNKGAFVMLLMFIMIVYLSYWIYGLNQQNNKLESSLENHKTLLSKSRETSYNRFIFAKDLSEICDRFKSSREAKMEYYFKNGIVD